MYMKLTKFTALCLCAVFLGSMALSACKKSEPANATADEATVTTTATLTQEETEVPTTATQEVTEAETTAAPETQPATKAPVKNNSASNSNSGNNTNGNSASAENKPVTCVITVDNKDHKVELGDTLTYTYYLKTPKKIENVQATVNYPGTTLKLLDTVLVTDFEEISDSTTLDKLNKELKGVFPVLGTSAIYNAYNHNIIKFNASNISGMDFTKGDYLIKLRFEVISGINGAVSTNVEFMDEVGGNPYVDNFKFTKDVEFKEELTR